MASPGPAAGELGALVTVGEVPIAARIPRPFRRGRGVAQLGDGRVEILAALTLALVVGAGVRSFAC